MSIKGKVQGEPFDPDNTDPREQVKSSLFTVASKMAKKDRQVRTVKSLLAAMKVANGMGELYIRRNVKGKTSGNIVRDLHDLSNEFKSLCDTITDMMVKAGIADEKLVSQPWFQSIVAQNALLQFRAAEDNDSDVKTIGKISTFLLKTNLEHGVETGEEPPYQETSDKVSIMLMEMTHQRQIYDALVHFDSVRRKNNALLDEKEKNMLKDLFYGKLSAGEDMGVIVSDIYRHVVFPAAVAGARVITGDIEDEKTRHREMIISIKSLARNLTQDVVRTLKHDDYHNFVSMVRALRRERPELYKKLLNGHGLLQQWVSERIKQTYKQVYPAFSFPTLNEEQQRKKEDLTQAIADAAETNKTPKND